MLTTTSGTNNSAFGYQALKSIGSGQQSTAIGYLSQSNNTGSFNTSVGAQSLSANSGNNNTAIGELSLNANTGTGNTAVGAEASKLNTSGQRNVSAGYQALLANLTTNDNTALGHQSLTANIASNNTAVGSQSLWINTTGTNNVSVGYQALINTKVNDQNTAIGANALGQDTIGGSNTALGFKAGYAISGGGTPLKTVNNSVYIGNQAYSLADNETNTIVIGSTAVGNGSNTTTIGTTSTVGTYLPAGGLFMAYAAKTGTYSITTSDYLINCTSGTFTATLPTAVGLTGRSFQIINSGSGTITIGTTSSQTFVNINATPTTLTLGAVGAGAIVGYTVTSNGANWIVTGKVKNE